MFCLLPPALIKATSFCRLATMLPSGLLLGAYGTSLISLLLVCCLPPSGEASQAGEGWRWGAGRGWGSRQGRAPPCCPGCSDTSLNSHQQGLSSGLNRKFWLFTSAFGAPRGLVPACDLSPTPTQNPFLDLCRYSSLCQDHFSFTQITSTFPSKLALSPPSGRRAHGLHQGLP